MGEIDNKWVGNRLRSIRMSKQLSQEAVATDLGLSHTGYANIEQGRTNIPFNRLVEITDYFNVSIKDFFCIEDKKPTTYTVNENASLYQTKEQIELQKEIAYLKQLILEKDKVISLLEKQIG